MSNIRIKRGNKSQDVNHNLLNVDTLNINVSVGDSRNIIIDMSNIPFPP